jgi:hypothetical protein
MSISITFIKQMEKRQFMLISTVRPTGLIRMQIRMANTLHSKSRLWNYKKSTKKFCDI